MLSVVQGSSAHVQGSSTIFKPTKIATASSTSSKSAFLPYFLSWNTGLTKFAFITRQNNMQVLVKVMPNMFSVQPECEGQQSSVDNTQGKIIVAILSQRVSPCYHTCDLCSLYSFSYTEGGHAYLLDCSCQTCCYWTLYPLLMLSGNMVCRRHCNDNNPHRCGSWTN